MAIQPITFTPSANPAPVGNATGGIKPITFTPGQGNTPPTPIKTSPTPISKPFTQPVQKPNLLQQAESIGQSLIGDVKGLFTPTGGKATPIVTSKVTTPTLTLTPDQKQSIATLKVGQVIPDFTSPQNSQSAKVTGSKGNILDNTIINPGDYLLNHTGIVGQAIKHAAISFYTNPVETMQPAFQNLEKDPQIAAKIKATPEYQFSTATVQGAVQGVLHTFGNSSTVINSFLSTEVKNIPANNKAKIAGNTVGNILGVIGSYMAGGEVAEGLNFGRLALPATFAALGQTSLSNKTSVQTREQNAIVDAAAGAFLEALKPLGNLGNMPLSKKAIAYSKQFIASIGSLSAQTYLDTRSEGATNEQALQQVKNSALLLLALHATLVAGKAADFATQSDIKSGSAEFTPDQARAAVVGSNLENTPTGNAIMKAALDAEGQGKSIQIDLSAAKEKPIAGTVRKGLGLATPNGIRVDNITLVEPSTTTANLPSGETSTSPEKVSPESSTPATSAPIDAHQETAQHINDVANALGNPSRYVSAADYASAEFSAHPNQQVGYLDPNTITPRDPVDRQSAQYKALTEDIQKNGIKEPIRIDAVTDKPITVDGSQRVSVAQDLGIKVPVIINNGLIPNLPTIAQVYHEHSMGEVNTEQIQNILEKQKTTEDPNDPVNQLIEVSKKVTNGIEPEAQTALDKITMSKDFAEFISNLHDLSELFGGSFNTIYDRIVSGDITEKEYESFQSHYSQNNSKDLSTKNGEGSQVAESASGNQEAAPNSENTQPESNPAGRGDNVEQRPSEGKPESVNSSNPSDVSSNTKSSESSDKTGDGLIPQGNENSISLDALNDTELKNLPEWETFEATLKLQSETGHISPSAILKEIKAKMEEAKQNKEDKNFGTALRTYFVGERDVRIAETNQLVLASEKLVKDKVEQDALTIMRDFAKRPEELAMILAGTHQYYDAAVERFKEENPDATERDITLFAQEILDRGSALTKVILKAQNPTEGMKKVNDAMTAYFKSRLEEGQKLGFLDSKISPEEYITHMLIPKEEALQEQQSKGFHPKKNKIGRYFQFAKGRAYKDIVEAYLNGVEPRTLNALDALAVYGDKHATVAATKLLIQQLKDTELGKWGSRGSEYVPKDWQPIAPESSLFKNEIPFVTQSPIEGITPEETAKWEKLVKNGEAKIIGDNYVKADIAHQSLYAPKKVVDALKPITDGDYMNTVPFFWNATVYQQYIKTVELGLSVFHMRALNITGFSNQGVVDYMKSQLADMSSTKFLEQEKNFIKAGGTSAILGRTFTAYKSARESGVSEKIHIPTKSELLKMVPGVKQLEGVANYLTHETFEVLQRKMKVTDFALKDARWIAKHPRATEIAHYNAQKDFAREINAVYGGLQWEVLGVNKMTQRILKFILLAPDWTFSNWFNAKAALPGFVGGNGGEASMAARGFWLRAVIVGVVLNQLWSLLMSRQLSKDPTKAYLGKDGAGKEVYTNIGFAGASSDMVNLIKNIGDYGIIEGVFKSVAAKEAPLLRTLDDFKNNRNYLGQTIVPKGSGVIVGTARSAYEIASNLSPIPFSISNMITMLSDTSGKYIPPEFLSILLGGGTSSHVVPQGEKQVTSGAKKGQLVPAKPNAPERPFWEQITSGKLYEPKKK